MNSAGIELWVVWVIKSWVVCAPPPPALLPGSTWVSFSLLMLPLGRAVDAVADVTVDVGTEREGGGASGWSQHARCQYWRTRCCRLVWPSRAGFHRDGVQVGARHVVNEMLNCRKTFSAVVSVRIELASGIALGPSWMGWEMLVVIARYQAECNTSPKLY